MTAYAFFQKKIVPLSEAKLGIMTHALHYGTAVFEGVRGNWNAEERQIYLFRALEHYERLLQSCKVLKITLPMRADELVDLTRELVDKCGFQEDVYIRPLAYKSSEVVGVRTHNLDNDILIFVVPFGNYLDVGSGIRCCTSSWRRIEDAMIPPRAKISGLYVNSALAKTEAMENGFDEAILLTQDGKVSEGSGENLFIVVHERLVTPPPWDNILLGITRDTVMRLAKEELGIETLERSITRSELYMADECFLTGTAAHLTPVLEIDHRKIATGQIGVVSKRLQDLYFDILKGKNPKYRSWCTPAYAKKIKA